MRIKRIIIQNFKCYEGEFVLDLNEGLNILVGDNEVGKSTILEAVNLALSGWIYGKYLGSELTQSLFNANVIHKYITSMRNKEHVKPPEILIELYFDTEDEVLKATFEGAGNSRNQKDCGLQFSIAFNEKYSSEYGTLLGSEDGILSLPIEYYDFSWSSFARDENITPRTIPLKSALIDSSSSRYQNGSDVYISRIIRDLLSDEDKIKISQTHRRMQSSFAQDSVIKNINNQITQREVSDKRIELSIDLSNKSAWEGALVTYLDGIPFSNIGKGEQCIVKTKLGLSHKKSKEANVLLIEEPENHLSHGKLNKLVKYIQDNNMNKQILISTHSSFVANKLGLTNLILLNRDHDDVRRQTAIKDLSKDTQEYFKKLSGYDTLRLILCQKAILVEGPSDELIVQKAYKVSQGVLPIENEVDVISVGTSFLRFLEISTKINKPTVVVTDNDGDFDSKITKKYEDYLGSSIIKICANKENSLHTLEPNIVAVNELADLLEILNLKDSKYKDKNSLITYMLDNKTECALKIFMTEKNINFPQYILDAII